MSIKEFKSDEESKKRVCECGYRYSHSYSAICPDCIRAKELAKEQQ